MLSNWEVEDIHRTLATNPSKKVEKRLNDQLSQHEYALKYPPFTPLPHHRQFLNRKTNEQIFHQIIEIAKESTTILLDTESTPVYRQPNHPSLIQLQLVPTDALPMVVIVETNHLPSTNPDAFKQMQEFFRIVLDSDKVIYTWGTIDELEPFVRFGLFTTKQIKQPDNEDLQSIFKDYWRRCHQHKSTKDCKCEKCLERKPDQKWKLLDAVAHQLNEWLDKRHTCSPFDIGLDPRLKQLRPEQLKYRNTLTNYAANDVLAMEKLMSVMEEQVSPLELTRPSTKQMKETSRIIHQDPPDPIDDMSIKLSIHSSPTIANIIDQSTIVNENTHKEQTDAEFEEEHFNHRGEDEQADLDLSKRNSKQHQHRYQEEIDGPEQTGLRHRFEYQNQADSSERTHHRYEPIRREQARQFERTDRQERNWHRERMNHSGEQDLPAEHRHEPRQIDQQPDQYRKRQRSKLNTETKRQLDNHNKRRRRELEQQQLKLETATTEAEKKKYRNRISTLKQRERKYKHEIIRRGIDPRFSIDIVKEILRKYNIAYTALNISKSKMTHRKSLYIGIDYRSKLCECEIRTKNLFTTESYNEFRARHHR